MGCIMKSNKAIEHAAAVSEQDLGELANNATTDLVNAILKGRNHEEQIALAKKLTTHVEMLNSPEPTISEKTSDFAADDELFLEHARGFYKNMRRKIYQAVCFLCSIEEIGTQIFVEDDKNVLFELKEKWAGWYEKDLVDSGPNTIKIKKAS